LEAKLYVGNMAYNTTEDQLRQLFSEAGTVDEVSIIIDRETRRSKGFAFVTMASGEDAAKAISMFDGKDVDGRTLKVNEAKPREDRPAGGRSFGNSQNRGGGGRNFGGGGQNRQGGGRDSNRRY
jgi:RNA recognition motif-containing protein